MHQIKPDDLDLDLLEPDDDLEAELAHFDPLAELGIAGLSSELDGADATPRERLRRAAWAAVFCHRMWKLLAARDGRSSGDLAKLVTANHQICRLWCQSRTLRSRRARPELGGEDGPRRWLCGGECRAGTHCAGRWQVLVRARYRPHAVRRRSGAAAAVHPHATDPR